ncbi:hypothetical protein RINTU1_27390 [Candidatus Regiella insecticola]|uniref:Uncharacterized protein n=1 Tax=Candidatus Regiella insecticola TaxID=138073 RepID=A0A6L2ZRB9_9ENTR|nr:hypothetical protein RINTU1_27390 [Candidatus Regiella insecticola]
MPFAFVLIAGAASADNHPRIEAISKVKGIALLHRGLLDNVFIKIRMR